MISYTTLDIIERARQIADLEDSSFISWNENLALVNEAYSSFYQKVIDKDEGYFVKNTEIEIGENKLPKDFYQIKYVGLINGKDNTPILRRPKTDNFEGLSYDVQGNSIFINGYSGTGKIVLSYYTVPPTLTFPAPDYDIDLDPNVVDANMNNYLYRVNENKLKIYNSKYDITKEFNITTNVNEQLKVFDNAIVIFRDATTYCSVHYFNGNSSTNKCYVVVGNSVKEFDELPTGYDVITPSTKYNFYYNFKDKMYGITYRGRKMGDILFNSVTIGKDGNIYFVTKDGLCVYDSSLTNVIYYIENEKMLFINDANLDKGYGILCYDNFLEKYYITSFLVNTKLNFSNTFFFPVIAYNLARSFKMKQGADFSLINVKYEEVLQQFFDSISVDSNNCVRIANVY